MSLVPTEEFVHRHLTEIYVKISNIQEFTWDKNMSAWTILTINLNLPLGTSVIYQDKPDHV